MGVNNTVETISFNELVAIISFIAGFITIVIGIVTIIWFVRDVRKQNSKELKNQTKILDKHSEILKEIHESNKEIHKETHEGNIVMQKSLERINESSQRQIKILGKIEAK